MPAFPASFGMPVRVDLSTSEPKAAEQFYGSLFRWQFSDAHPAYGGVADSQADGRRVATRMGMPVSVVLEADDEQRHQWRVNFHVDDAAAAAEHARECGAQVVQEAVALVDGSKLAIIADPAGALVGLLEQPGEQAFFAAGEPGTPVWFELLSSAGANGDAGTNGDAGADKDAPGVSFDSVMDFYHQLFGWEIAIRAKTDQFTYAVGIEEGAPFVGLAHAEQAAGQGWMAYFGVENIDAAVAEVKQNGGEVLSEPQMTEFGPLATVKDSAGVTTIICEVPPAPAEDISEAEDLFSLDLSGHDQTRPQ